MIHSRRLRISFAIAALALPFQNCSSGFDSRELSSTQTSAAEPGQVDAPPPAAPASPAADPVPPPIVAPPIVEPAPRLSEDDWELGALLGGELDSYLGRAQIKVASAHLGRQGYFLFMITHNNSRYVLDRAQQNWVLWDGAMATFSTAAEELASTVDFGPVLIRFLDLTRFGGGTLQVAYGLGDTISAAVQECLANERVKAVDTFPIQLFRGSVTIPPNFDKTSTNELNVYFHINPDYRDYGSPGVYYIVAISPDGATTMVFKDKKWIPRDPNGTEPLYTHATEALANYETYYRVSGIELAKFVDWTMYVGYGKTLEDMLNRKLFTKGVVVK